MNNDNDGKHTEKFLIKCILENKARDCEYLKYIPKYPQIMKYLLNDDDSNSTQISLRYLEPFVKEYVNKTKQKIDKNCFFNKIFWYFFSR